MKWFILAASALLSLSAALSAQTAPVPPPNSSIAVEGANTAPKHRAPRPAAQEAPGGGPDKVWVNLTSSKYHCPGSRYYGKTAHGRYMTEPAARSAGAKGTGGKVCFAK